jgi:hypothetical protein
MDAGTLMRVATVFYTYMFVFFSNFLGHTLTEGQTNFFLTNS